MVEVTCGHRKGNQCRKACGRFRQSPSGEKRGKDTTQESKDCSKNSASQNSEGRPELAEASIEKGMKGTLGKEEITVGEFTSRHTLGSIKIPTFILIDRSEPNGKKIDANSTCQCGQKGEDGKELDGELLA